MSDDFFEGIDFENVEVKPAAPDNQSSAPKRAKEKVSNDDLSSKIIEQDKKAKKSKEAVAASAPKRSKSILIRLTEQEYTCIKDRHKQPAVAGRELLLNGDSGERVEYYDLGVKEFTTQISRIGNNFNQISHGINKTILQGGYSSSYDLFKALESIALELQFLREGYHTMADVLLLRKRAYGDDIAELKKQLEAVVGKFAESRDDIAKLFDFAETDLDILHHMEDFISIYGGDFLDDKSNDAQLYEELKKSFALKESAQARFVRLHKLTPHKLINSKMYEFTINRRVDSVLTFDVCSRHQCIPIAEKESSIAIALSRPWSRAVQRSLAVGVKLGLGLDTMFYACPPKQMDELLKLLEGRVKS